MFGTKKNNEKASLNKETDAEKKFNAIWRSMAIVEFDASGTIVSANPNFLSLFEYSASEIVGKHHSILCDKSLNNHELYKELWRKLSSGEFVNGRFSRKNKRNKVVWVDASYNPIVNTDGKVDKILKVAIDATEKVQAGLELNSSISAINRSMAIIELSVCGDASNTNENFTELMGYELPEIIDQPHKIFCRSIADVIGLVKEINTLSEEISEITTKSREEANAVISATGRLSALTKQGDNI